MVAITLKDDWRTVLRKAWSVRFMALAAVLSGAEVVLPLFVDTFTRGTFALLSFAAVAGGVVARIVAQRDV
jgi:hypothetical protein